MKSVVTAFHVSAFRIAESPSIDFVKQVKAFTATIGIFKLKFTVTHHLNKSVFQP